MTDQHDDDDADAEFMAKKAEQFLEADLILELEEDDD